MNKNTKNSWPNAWIAALCVSFVCMSAAWAYHPISNQGPFDSPYPAYPKIDYGTGADAEIVKRGEYLTKAGDCLACHTAPSTLDKPFAGGLEIATPFGIFYSPNITPDNETGIGKWTEEEFVNAMHEGKSPNGSNYYPVFPYIYFSKASKDDLRAMYAYFKKVPAIHQPNQELNFPFNWRLSRFAVNGWRAMFFRDKDEYQYDANRSSEWNRGAYLVQSFGHCGMCHTPLNVFGAPKKDYFLTGAFIDGYWAPNITGYGLKSASIYEIAQVFGENGQLINRAGPVAGPMAEVNHNSLNFLNKDDQVAIATYLKSVASRDPHSVPPTDHEDNLKRGKQVFINACIMCHQENVVNAPAIGDSGWFNRVKTEGVPALYRHTINGYNKMPVRGACVTCNDKDIKSAVDYILHESLKESQWRDVQTGKVAARDTPASGAAVYKENCSVCHDNGNLGAPKLGDKKMWDVLLRKNVDVLIKNTITGINGSHVRGGCQNCTNTEIIAAVKYMVNESSDNNYKLW